MQKFSNMSLSELHLLLRLLPDGLLCRPPSPRACPPKP